MKEFKITSGNIRLSNLVREIEKFREFSEQELHSFIDAGRLREYEPTEIIVSEGDFDCWVYFLIHGNLEIRKDGEKIGTLERCGDLFGEMGVIDGSARSATITAQSKSILLGFDASMIDQKLKTKQINFCYIIYRIFSEVLAARLRETTEVNIHLSKEVLRLQEELDALKAKTPR